MNAVSLGPLVFSVERFAAILGIALFLLATELWGLWRGRRGQVSSWAFAAVVAGLLLARLGFVLGNIDSYRQAPLDVFRFWQGGFDPRVGLFGFIAVVIVSIIRQASVVRPLVVSAILAGLCVQGVRVAAGTDTPDRLPETSFARLAGAPATPAERHGRPLVLNLWASWCPPCVREMPMMVEVAESSEDVDVLFANQGETPGRIRRFLERLDLKDDRILLDPEKSLMTKIGTLGLPATLFVDAEGRVQALQIGEISRAALNRQMRELLTPQNPEGDTP